MNKKRTIFMAFTLCATQWVVAAETNLGSIGQTQLQQDTGDAVQRTCIGFVESGALPGTIPLFDTCSAMVLTANELLGLGTSDASLGLSTDQLAAALQQIATEEYAATESIANEISANRMDSVISRLHSLRGGARGFAISGIGAPGAGLLMADNDRSRAYGSRGAGAGDELLDNALSGFASINFGTGDRDSTDSSDAFDFSNSRVTLGVDYRLDSNLVIGGAVNYSRIDTDFDKHSTVSGGNVDTDGWGGVLYGTYYRDQYYIDGLIGYAVSDYDIKRVISIPSNTAAAAISDTAKATPESSDYSFSIGGGYALGQGPVSFGPYFRASYMRVDIDGYQEQGAEASGLNLSVADQEWTSLTSVLGLEYAYTLSQQQSVIIPQVKLGWVHQYENDSSEITATYVNDPRNNRLSVLTDNPDRNYFELSLGISSVIQDGIQLFVNYDTLLGLENMSDHQITLGGRWEY